MSAPRALIDVRLIGGFSVHVDGHSVPDKAWARRDAAALVQLLAVAPHHRLHREQVIDRLWPDTDVGAAPRRLHKAAHFARRALGDRDGVVLRDEVVALAPTATVRVDVDGFRVAAAEALAVATRGAAVAALAVCSGEVLPDRPYDEWIEPYRAEVSFLRRSLLHQARRWRDLLAIDSTDEDAHLGLVNARFAAGDRAGALRQWQAMADALVDGLGVEPSETAYALRDSILAAEPIGVERRIGAPRRCRAHGARRPARPPIPTAPVWR